VDQASVRYKQGDGSVSVPAHRLAWSLWGLAFGFGAAGLLFGVLSFSARLPEGREPLLASVVVLDGLLVLYGTLGALISSRRPRNTIGWLFCFMALLLGLLSAAYGYADYALYVRENSLPGARIAAWATNWLPTAAVYVPACFLFLLFPDGRPASPRWRPVIWVLAVVAAVSVFASALEPRIFTFPTVENPLGLGESVGSVASVANELTNLTAIPAFLVSLASMILRLRRARGRERLQLKWVAYAASLTATSFAASFVTGALTDWRTASDAFFLLGVAGFASIPVAAGVAILRHRLYDIDRIINRTLVYGALTIMLALVYFGGVAALQTILRSLTEQGSQLAIVASTLAIAALFGPLRRRIQGFIDRRFYRRKYDAAKTLEAFSSRLRDEVELEVLNADLIGVVRETVQPQHASLWLRDREER
jgi:hypothetical protein